MAPVSPPSAHFADQFFGECSMPGFPASFTRALFKCVHSTGADVREDAAQVRSAGWKFSFADRPKQCHVMRGVHFITMYIFPSVPLMGLELIVLFPLNKLC